MFKLKWIDFHHVYNLVLVGNNKSISKHQNIQYKRFFKLSDFIADNACHDPEQVLTIFQVIF